MKRRSALYLLMILCTFAAGAKQLNDKVLNRPYADLKAWHLGFSVGVHAQDLQFTNNGTTPWMAEQPAFSPGFCVNGLIDFRLHTHFNVRLAPGIWFGNKVVDFLNTDSDQTLTQNIKSTLLVLPIDLKMSALRYRNVRPYVAVGVMPAIDVSKRRSSEFIHLKKYDTFLTVSLGLDTYFPYFKFVPEVKFCFGLSNVLLKSRPDLDDDPATMAYTNSLDRISQKMVVLTFYFE